MNNETKKLPQIEIGDTVVFRTDLELDKYYGVLTYKATMIEYTNGKHLTVTKVNDCYGWLEVKEFSILITPEMVAQVIKASEVIKPSKARVYSDIEYKAAIEKAFDDGFENGYDCAQGDGAEFEEGTEYVKSLNTEGK